MLPGRLLTFAGLITLLALTACDRGPGPGKTAIIASIDSPQLAPKCPEGQCREYTVQNFRCNRWMRASTVIVAGNVSPPNFLSMSAEKVAQAVRCFHPELVVIDTSFGTSTELLKALVQAGARATIVASPSKVPAESFSYGPAFWTAEPITDRAAAVLATIPSQKVIRWPLNGAAIEKAERFVASMSKDELTSRLQHTAPNLVKVEPEPGIELLVSVPPERLR